MFNKQKMQITQTNGTFTGKILQDGTIIYTTKPHKTALDCATDLKSFATKKKPSNTSTATTTATNDQAVRRTSAAANPLRKPSSSTGRKCCGRG